MRNYLPRTIGLAVSFPKSSNSICVTFNVTIILTGLFSEILSSQLRYSLKQRAISDCDVTLQWYDFCSYKLVFLTFFEIVPFAYKSREYS